MPSLGFIKDICAKEAELKILYIDPDSTLVDFRSGIDRLDSVTMIDFEGRLDEVPGIFGL